MNRLLQIAPVLLLIALFVSCSRQPPDRTIAIQLPLFGLVLLAPAMSLPLKRRDSGIEIIVFILQVVAYVIYETGVSVTTDNRADLVLMFPAIALNAWIVFGDLGTPSVKPEDGEVIAGVSVPLVQAKCHACGKIYPSRKDLQDDGAGRQVCNMCIRTS